MASSLQQVREASWRGASPAGSSSGQRFGRRAVSRRAPAARRLAVTRAEQAEPESMGVWERLQLARRQLDLAVREEDYKAAAQAQREVAALTGRLPASKALLLALLDKLERTAWVAGGTSASSSASSSSGNAAAAAAAGGAAGGKEAAAVAERMSALAQLGELGDWDGAPALAAALHDGDALAAAAEEGLWTLFMACPTPELRQSMVQGVTLMRRPEQWDQALELFNDMVKTAPKFAEAYNKRATVLYLQQRYADAISDCRVVLEMNPYHFAAASGMGMCCGAVGDNAGALAAFQQAVAINPRLRHLRQHILRLRQTLQQGDQAGPNPTSGRE